MNRIFKIGLLVMIIGATAYAGACAYANFVSFKKADAQTQIQLPPVSEAKYYVTVSANANVFLCNNYETWGTKAGERTFVLHGYWESVGTDFKFRDRDLYLAENVYGSIEVKARPKPTPTPTTTIKK
jgi:hypothetical protein